MALTKQIANIRRRTMTLPEKLVKQNARKAKLEARRDAASSPEETELLNNKLARLEKRIAATESAMPG